MNDFDRDESRMRRMNGLLALQVLPVDPDTDNPKRNPLTYQPVFRVVTKIVASAHANGALHNGCFTSEAIAGSKERARIYEVTRNLAHFTFFQQCFYEKNPFTVTVQLPDRFAAHSVEGVDQVLSLLFMIAASEVTNSDPLFWSFLTLPDSDYVEQYTTLSSKTKTERVGGLLQFAKSKLTARLPQVELKPSDISNMMIETGMVDRAFISIDKVSSCAERSMYFQKVLQDQEHLLGWEAALRATYDVRDAVEAEAEALTAVGDVMMHKVADAQYWPWTKIKLLSSPAEAGIDVAHAPPVSKRLAQFLQRTGNTVHQLSRHCGNVVSSDFGLSTSLQSTTELSRKYSAKLAHEYLHITHPPKPTGRTLVQLQDLLMEIIAHGSGFEEADRLDAIDEDISEIHDVIDQGIDAFEQQYKDVRVAMTERLLRNLREMQVEQMLAWTSAQMLLSNVLTALDTDPFEDAEDLPIMELADDESPCRLHERKVAEERQLNITRTVHPEQIISSGQQQQQQQPDDGTTFHISGKGGAGLFYRPSKPSPARHVDAASSSGNPYESEELRGSLRHMEADDRKSSKPASASDVPSDPRLIELQSLVQKQSKTNLLDAKDDDLDDFGADGVVGKRRSVQRGPSSQQASPLQQTEGAGRKKWMNEEDSADPFQW